MIFVLNFFFVLNAFERKPLFFFENFFFLLLDRSRGSQLNASNEREILKQNRYLYLLVKELCRDVKEIKDELKWQRKDKANDLSSQVLDVSGSGFALFNYKLWASSKLYNLNYRIYIQTL